MAYTRCAMERKSGKRNLSRWLVWFAVKNTHTQKSFRLKKKKFRQTELEEIIKRRKRTIPGIFGEEAIEKQWRREFRSVMFTLVEIPLHTPSMPISFPWCQRSAVKDHLLLFGCRVHLFFLGVFSFLFHARDVDSQWKQDDGNNRRGLYDYYL